MYLVINKWVIAVKVSNFSGQYFRNHWTLDIGVLGYIVIVWPKEHSPEIRSFPSGTPCIYIYILINCKAWNLLLHFEVIIKTLSFSTVKPDDGYWCRCIMHLLKLWQYMLCWRIVCWFYLTLNTTGMDRLKIQIFSFTLLYLCGIKFDH